MSDERKVRITRVRTEDELEASSDRFRVRYGKDSPADADDPARSALIFRLKTFLKVCAAHGRYVAIGTPERRRLRNLVDYWTSRLSRNRYNVSDIPGLKSYDANAGVPLLNVDCPYPGLEPYDDEHKRDFFGRERLAGEYATNLEEHGVFLIIGGSGSGKSSVALAGVRPVGQWRHPDWCFPEAIKPGSDPLGALVASIVKETAGDAQELVRQLNEKISEKKWEDAARVLGDALEHKPTLLIIDQFEEVLTLCSDAAAQRAFAEVLLALASLATPAGARGFFLLFTLRTDHQGRFEDNPGLKPLHDRLTQQGCYAYLPSMQQEEVLQAILKPARRVRLRFVPEDVAEKLAGQAASLVNGLPLLQFTLQRLWWEERDPKTYGKGRPRDFIHEDQLKELGDVSSALGTRAEKVYQALGESQKRICERLILELVFLDETFTEALRRRRPVDELVDVISGALGFAAAAVRDVIETFADARLLRISSEKGRDQLEVAHEALLRHWDTISKIVYGDEAKARLFRIKEVLREAAEWKKNTYSKGWLKQRGEPLERLEQDVKARFLIDQDSLAYVAACREDEKRIKRGEEERLAAEKKAQDALLAQKEAERERAEADLKRVLAAKEIAEQQSRLLEAEREKKDAFDAQTRAENEKKEAERQEKERARWRKWSVVGVSILGAVILFAGASYVKQRNDSNLSASASLSDRLPPWEGLDLTHTLAKNNEIFSGALGHALERMNGARIVGARGSALTLLGDGSDLMEIPKVDGATPDTVYLHLLNETDDATAELLSSSQGVAVDLGGKFKDGNLGSRIEAGPLQGKRLFVAMVAPVSGWSLRAKAWLIDFGKSKAEPVGVPEGLGDYYASQIAMRPDGLEASWGTWEGQRKTGHLVRLGLAGYPAKPDFRNDPIVERKQIVDALGYVTNGDGRFSLVRATEAGLSCDKDMSKGQASVVPAKAIFTTTGADVFAVGRGDGRIELFRCNDGKVTPLPLEHEALSGDFLSVRLNRMGGDSLLLSYQMTGGGFQCYEVSGMSLKQKSCNPNHPIAALAPLGKETQVVIEASGAVPVVRRYPRESALERFRFMRVGWQGRAVLCEDGADEKVTKPGARVCNDRNEGAPAAAVLSPSGAYKATMMRGNAGVEIDVAKPLAGKVGTSKVADYLGERSALAVDDQGRLAYFRKKPREKQTEESGLQAILFAPESGSGKPFKLDGVPTCLSFSPANEYLVVGTKAGGTFRYGIKSGTLEPPKTTDLVTGGKDSSKADPDAFRAEVTACAIADDGAAVFGFKDGQVRYFDGDLKTTALTERVVYRLPAEVKAVSIGEKKSGVRRRITALGAWQPNNCLYPALPGQSLRVWELGDEKMEKIPVSNVCFPNQPILAIGEWTQRPLTGNVAPPTVKAGLAGAGAITGGAGIQLLLPQGARWHACPGCRLENESDAKRRARLVGMAEAKGSIGLGPDVLNTRYGLKLGW